MLLMYRYIRYMLCMCLCSFPGYVYCQKRCHDCVKAIDCETALQCLHQGAIGRQIIQQEFCGFATSGAPMVCCSSLEKAIASKNTKPSHPHLSLLPKECGFIDGNRIVGGEEAKLYQFPWMTLLSSRTREGPDFHCGGALINERYVLTAAHCVWNRKLLGVRIGEHDTSTEEDCQGHGIKVTCETRKQDKLIDIPIVHKSYNGNARNGYDIALLRLMHPVDLTYRNAKPICLPVTNELRERIVSGENATVAGWGYTEYGYYSSKLLNVKIPVVSEERCRSDQKLSPSDEIKIICAGSAGKDSCYGDSGGPLMIEGTYHGISRYILQGIVSFGPSPCGTGRPGIYTDVAKYMDWILDNIEP